MENNKYKNKNQYRLPKYTREQCECNRLVRLVNTNFGISHGNVMRIIGCPLARIIISISCNRQYVIAIKYTHNTHNNVMEYWLFIMFIYILLYYEFHIMLQYFFPPGDDRRTIYNNIRTPSFADISISAHLRDDYAIIL